MFTHKKTRVRRYPSGLQQELFTDFYRKPRILTVGFTLVITAVVFWRIKVSGPELLDALKQLAAQGPF